MHLTPQEGWINDPLGLTVRDGTWHVFFQFVPGHPRWSPEQRWGHATSLLSPRFVRLSIQFDF